MKKVQRRAARFVQNRYRNTSSVGEILEQLEWPTLQQRRKDARITMLSKILDKKVEVKCKDLKPASDRTRKSSVCHKLRNLLVLDVTSYCRRSKLIGPSL